MQIIPKESPLLLLTTVGTGRGGLSRRSVNLLNQSSKSLNRQVLTSFRHLELFSFIFRTIQTTLMRALKLEALRTHLIHCSGASGYCMCKYDEDTKSCDELEWRRSWQFPIHRCSPSTDPNASLLYLLFRRG